MRLVKSLLLAASVCALSAGTAFAGQDSTVTGSVETSPPELLSDESLGEDAYRGPIPKGPSDELALEEGEVIYIYPMEVTDARHDRRHEVKTGVRPANKKGV